MENRRPAEVFPPGVFIQEELEARGWSQLDFAEIIGRAPRLVNEIIGGKRGITPETATAIGEAFGTGARIWLNLQTAYQLSLVKDIDEGVAKRARLFTEAPIKEMVRRHWIEPSNNVDVLGKRLSDFWGGKPQSLAHAARKSTDYAAVSPSQLVWLVRVKRLAEGMLVDGTFSQKTFSAAMQELQKLAVEPEEVGKIPRVLSKAGIRFLVVQHLQSTRIDGVTLWLNDKAPVIAVSLRFDRIDSFWHTLMHEMGHVARQDGMTGSPTIDTDLVGNEAQLFESKPEAEQRADEFAASSLVDQKRLDKFIAKVKPVYSHVRVAAFAKTIGVHPGIVVGQLHHRKEIRWDHSRQMLAKVRDIVTSTALTDGWGH